MTPHTQTLKMKKCKQNQAVLAKAAGFSRVFGVHSGFQFSCEKPLVAQTTCW